MKGNEGNADEQFVDITLDYTDDRDGSEEHVRIQITGFKDPDVIFAALRELQEILLHNRHEQTGGLCEHHQAELDLLAKGGMTDLEEFLKGF